MSTTRHTLRIGAPSTDVYRALLDPTLIPRWRVPAGMRCDIHRFEPREGGTFRVSLTYHSTSSVGKSSARTDTYSGHFEQLVPGQRIVERLAFETTDPQMQGDMRITTDLIADGDGTRVTVEHEGLPPGVAPADNDAGWQESLYRLAALFATDIVTYYHGTRAVLHPGDLIRPGYGSNYTERRSPWVYFSATLEAATWGAELAKGDGPGHVYVVEPMGTFVDDPNVTDKRYPGNPTKSFRSQEPLKVVVELLDWQGHSSEAIQAMKTAIAGLEPIDD